MRQKAPHITGRPGKRVRIVLRDGKEIIGRYKEHTDRYVFLEDQRIAIADIRSYGIYREKSSP